MVTSCYNEFNFQFKIALNEIDFRCLYEEKIKYLLRVHEYTFIKLLSDSPGSRIIQAQEKMKWSIISKCQT